MLLGRVEDDAGEGGVVLEEERGEVAAAADREAALGGVTDEAGVRGGGGEEAELELGGTAVRGRGADDLYLRGAALRVVDQGEDHDVVPQRAADGLDVAGGKGLAEARRAHRLGPRGGQVQHLLALLRGAHGVVSSGWCGSP